MGIMPIHWYTLALQWCVVLGGNSRLKGIYMAVGSADAVPKTNWQVWKAAYAAPGDEPAPTIKHVSSASANPGREQASAARRLPRTLAGQTFADAGRTLSRTNSAPDAGGGLLIRVAATHAGAASAWQQDFGAAGMSASEDSTALRSTR